MPTYKLIKGYDAGGDFTKEWLVQYHYLIPEELRKPGGKTYERFKVFNTINSIHSKKERLQQLNLVKESIRELLELGFSPYEQFRYSDSSYQEKHNICRCIDEYLEFAKATLKS